MEVPIPDQDHVSNLYGTKIPIRLGLNFDQAGTNGAMIHVMVLNAKVRRHEQLWLTMNIGNIFGSTFGFKNSQSFQFKE